MKLPILFPWLLRGAWIVVVGIGIRPAAGAGPAVPDPVPEVPLSASAASPAPIPLVGFAGEWRYRVGNDEPGSGWTGREYDDRDWPRARGAFHAGTPATTAALQTALPLTNAAGESIVTFRFRTEFVHAGPREGLWLVCSNLLDDGAVFLLNGRELGRLRMPAGPVTPSTHGFPGPRGGASTLVFGAGPLVEGTNVLAVEVHQRRAPNRDLLFDASLGLVERPPPMPDLVVAPPRKPHWVRRRFAASECEVAEGCARPGERRLLKFDATTLNVGDADLVLGAPGGNPLFEFASCHGHHHFGSYLAARLVAADGTVVSQGTKIGFALVDGVRWDPVLGPPTPRFTDDFQGLQRGWSDSYAYFLPCQHVDVTDVPPGDYELELEIDPDRKLPESNESNNVTRIPVEVPVDWPACTGPPRHDALADAVILPRAAGTVVVTNTCATREPGEPALSNEFGITGTSSVWFRWTAPFDGPAVVDTDGSNFPCLLGVFSGGGLRELRRIGADTKFDLLPKRVAWTATAGTTYSVAVSGLITTHPTFGTHVLDGEVVLNLNPGRNDAIERAEILSGPVGSVLAQTAQASRGADEPAMGEDASGRTVWFRWTPDADGAVSFGAEGSRFPARVMVFTGAPEALVPAGELARSGPDRVVVRAWAGTALHIGLDGRGGASGLARLAWEPALRLDCRIGEGGVLLTVLNPAGLPVRIESSTDLRRWVPEVRTSEASYGKAVVTAPGSGPGFYRARFE